MALELPPTAPLPVETVLPNGIRLIVRQVTITPTITVRGKVRHNGETEAPRGKEGVSEVLNELFSYGTKTLDRIAFQKALDEIAAELSAGDRKSTRLNSSHGSSSYAV